MMISNHPVTSFIAPT